LLTAALVVAAACSNQPTSQLSRLNADILDGSSGGNPHFFFLPPMVGNPGTGTANDATVSPEVQICQWDGASCVFILANYTTDLATTTSTQPGNSETVHRSDAHFNVDWHTENFPLDPTATYRVCVKLNGVELGFADVDLAASGRELRVVADGYIGVLDGRTLPIVFRIEPGAQDAGGGNCGGQPV
jgi:hypothetical protein